MANVVRLGDSSNHGGVIITASSNVITNGVNAATLGDLHSCPIQGHGITEIVTGSPDVAINSTGTSNIGVTAACGAIIITGSPNVSAN